MKNATLFTTLLALSLGAMAQSTLLLHLDGESPDPFDDRTANNTVVTVGSPTTNAGAIEFTTGNDYLKIDPFVSFDLEADWTVEFDIKITSNNDTIFFIDWRSNSSVGHMHYGYDVISGIYFSDRNINTIYGNIVADSSALPLNTWVTAKIEKDGDSIRIYRDNAVTARVQYTDTLSELSTTTIGYSEDFRFAHATFYMDNIKVYGGSGIINSITEQKGKSAFSLYPNPMGDKETIYLQSKEAISSSELFTVGGQLIGSYGKEEKQLNVGTLSAGIYLLRITFADGRQQTEKLLR